MTQITKNTIFSELLIANSHLIPIVNRFGVRLGVGDKTIIAVCKENDVNVYFFITLLQIYIDVDLYTDEYRALYDVSDVIEYLKVTIEYFSNVTIPNIEKHFSPLIAMSDGDNEELKLLNKILYQFKSDFSNQTQQGLEQKTEYSIDLLKDLKSILIKHISGNYNHNLVYAVIFLIDSLKKEILLLNRIFDLLLSPKLEELDSDNIESLSHIFTDEQKNISSDSYLTNREIEVLKMIVQGNTNKETAHKLNISLNTVLSHRKNIISKTGVKTISGLTFYAISNGYVSSAGFKM